MHSRIWVSMTVMVKTGLNWTWSEWSLTVKCLPSQGWHCMLNFCPWSPEPPASCWLRYLVQLSRSSMICQESTLYIIRFCFSGILGSGHCFWGPLSDLGDAHSGLALAAWPVYHTPLHLCHPVLREYDFMIFLPCPTRCSLINLAWVLGWMGVWAVATRKCSIRRADGKPGKGSGHAEADCYGKQSTNASGKTYRCQTSKSTQCLDVIINATFYLQAFFCVCLFF